MMKNLKYNWNMPNDDKVSFAMEGNKKNKKRLVENYERHENELGKKKDHPKESPCGCKWKTQ